MAFGQGREGDAPLVAVIAALAAILGGMVSGNYAVLGVTATIDSAHQEASIARRSTAYGSYLGELAKFNEFLWSQSYWAGTDIGTGKPTAAQSGAFWPRAAQMQADLDSAYRAASMGTNSSRLLDDLKRLHDSQQKVLDQFKCMSQAQTDSCSYKPALHEAIIAVLQHWSNETETNKTTLVKDARASLA